MDENTIPHTEPWLPRWDGVAYAANTGHHRANDAWYLERFPVRPADRLLDVGCGSGDFTVIVAALVPDGHVVGVDPQPTMLEEAARVARPNQSFAARHGPRPARAVAPDAAFDAVFTRATLQWVPWAEHPGVVESMAALVRPGGWVRVEMGGHGNIRDIADVVSEISLAHGGGVAPWAFPDAAQYLDLFERAGLDATQVARCAPPTSRPATCTRSPSGREFNCESLARLAVQPVRRGVPPGLPADVFEPFRAEVLASVDRLRPPTPASTRPSSASTPSPTVPPRSRTTLPTVSRARALAARGAGGPAASRCRPRRGPGRPPPTRGGLPDGGATTARAPRSGSSRPAGSAVIAVGSPAV